MDRNDFAGTGGTRIYWSLSARRAWIEISMSCSAGKLWVSLSARRAWIEISAVMRQNPGRSPQGERG